MAELTYTKYIGVEENNKNKVYIVVQGGKKITRDEAIKFATNKYFKSKVETLDAKTCYLTGEDNEDLYFEKVRNGVKAIAVYRK